ncbi:MAG: phage holin family protein [Candidatus Harrisonbacteria bacterium]|nr:phage holin family protein [Candidatus Harrisonbacteria bacterium]
MIGKIILGLISNSIALFLVKRFVDGIALTDGWVGIAIVVVLFTAANSIILPVARFVFAPLKWLTLGLLPLALNGILIYIVDFLSDDITISGFVPLLIATVIFGVINGTFAYGAKVLKQS